MIIGTGLALVSLLIFVYFTIDCIRRNATDFPSIVYGGNPIRPRIVKRSWTWLLILSLTLGWTNSLTIWSHTTTGLVIESPRTVESSYQSSSPFFIDRVEIIGEYETHERAIRIPIVFFLGMYLYYRGVKRRPGKPNLSL